MKNSIILAAFSLVGILTQAQEQTQGSCAFSVELPAGSEETGRLANSLSAEFKGLGRCLFEAKSIRENINSLISQVSVSGNGDSRNNDSPNIGIDYLTQARIKGVYQDAQLKIEFNISSQQPTSFMGNFTFNQFGKKGAAIFSRIGEDRHFLSPLFYSIEGTHYLESPQHCLYGYQGLIGDSKGVLKPTDNTIQSCLKEGLKLLAEKGWNRLVREIVYIDKSKGVAEVTRFQFKSTITETYEMDAHITKLLSEEQQ